MCFDVISSVIIKYNRNFQKKTFHSKLKKHFAIIVFANRPRSTKSMLYIGVLDKTIQQSNFLKTFKTAHLLQGQKSFPGNQFLSHHAVSLSSLYLSCNWIELNQLIYFIEEHSLEKLHVRGSFFDSRTDLREEFRGYTFYSRSPFPELSPGQLSFRTDFDLILSKIVKKMTY